MPYATAFMDRINKVGAKKGQWKSLSSANNMGGKRRRKVGQEDGGTVARERGEGRNPSNAGLGGGGLVMGKRKRK